MQSSDPTFVSYTPSGNGSFNKSELYSHFPSQLYHLISLQSLRPPPLRSTLWAFLFPHVPLVPSAPKDVSNAGQSPTEDARLFPSDELLSQRTIWIAFLLVLGWTILGLAGALPLYLVGTPCLAHMPSTSQYTGAYSTLQDLSLLRLLRLWDTNSANISSSRIYLSRVTLGSGGQTSNLHIRVIILTVLVIVVALLPAIYKIMKEFDLLVAYRKRWIETKCGGKEMGWLSIRRTPGFTGWGEKRLKDFILKTGLSSSLESNVGRNGARKRTDRSRTEESRQTLNGHGTSNPAIESGSPEIDVQSLFSIV